MKMKVKVIGHKGASGYAPENTKASLMKAIELGVDAIEVDIRLTKDNNLVVFHDPYLDKITGHAGAITDKMTKDLEELDVGSWFDPRFKGERILTLEEAMNLVLDKADLIIELKRPRSDGERYKGFEERVLDLLSRKKAKERILISSFDHYSLKELKELDPSLRIGMLFSANWLNLWDEVELLKPEAIHPHWAFTTREMVEEAHNRGITINSWVVNEESRMRKLIDLGVDGIITDYPDRLIRILQGNPFSSKKGS